MAGEDEYSSLQRRSAAGDWITGDWTAAEVATRAREREGLRRLVNSR